jgi:hypothetical protein
MSKMLSALVGASMLGLVGAANAAEPIALSDAQLDSVNAGFSIGNTVFGNNNIGIGQVNSDSTAFLNVNTGIGQVN